MAISWKRLPRGHAAGAPFDGSDVLLAVPSIVRDQRGREVGVDPDHPYARYIAYWVAERMAWATTETEEDTQKPIWLALDQPRFWAELDDPTGDLRIVDDVWGSEGAPVGSPSTKA